jgi:two-component system response regulator AtoC
LVVLADGPTIRADAVGSELSVQAGFETQVPLQGAPDPPPQSSVVGPLDDNVSRAERHALVRALRQAAGNRSLAARLLGISRRTLYNKLAAHGLD